jgi:rubredoxin
MPWKCPACGSLIQHTENIPNPAVTYRCQICRLELRMDPETNKLVVVPLHEDEKDA